MEALLDILSQFGGGKADDPGGIAVRFLLPCFFWLILVRISFKEWKSGKDSKDFYVMLAAAVGAMRELIMFTAEFGGHHGLVEFDRLHKYYPPLEHAARLISGITLGYAFMRSYIKGETFRRVFFVVSGAATLLVYAATAHGWIGFLEKNPGAKFSLFWGDVAFRLLGVICMSMVVSSLAYAGTKGRHVSALLLAGFSLFLLDDLLMLINIFNAGSYAAIIRPVRHNLHIWAVPAFLGVYWKDQNLSLQNALLSAKREKEKSEAIIAALGEGVSIQDPDLKVLYQNQAHKDFIGGDKTGQYCYRAYQRRESACEGCHLLLSFRDGCIHKAERTRKSDSGETHYVEIISSPLRDETGKITGGIELVRDITERKKLEEQLRHSQKMEAVGTLTSGIAHEFNNIMTSIIGFSEMVLDSLEESNSSRKYVEIIASSAKRAAGLTQGLLTYSRKQPTQLQTASVNEIISRIEGLISKTLRADIAFSVVKSPVDIMIKADTNQIEQAVINLATNARDAMPESGSLTIEASSAFVGEEPIHAYGAFSPGRFAVITVKDTGSGIDESIKSKIFEPFFTTKDIGKGTGLGLSMVLGIIEKHGGFLSVESSGGKGTVVSMYIPAVEFRESAHRPEPPREAAGGSETILLAEDDDAVRELVKTLLERHGYNVVIAVDGADAVRKYGENAGRIDMLLLDLVMPGVSGKEAYDGIKRMRPDIKVLFMSGYSDDIMAEKGIIDGELSFLSKPVSARELLSKLREILNG